MQFTLSCFHAFTLFDQQDGSPNHSDDAFIKALKDAPHIRKGLSGEIQGPVDYEDEQYMCERIMCRPTKKNEENTVRENGQKWKKLNHKNLIKVVDTILRSPAVYIVLEYSPGDSVRDALDKCTEDLPMTEVLDWATQIAQGISHLHENGIVHKNIKSTQSEFILQFITIIRPI